MNTQNEHSCFKAYDIRGKLGSEINSKIAYRIGNVAAKKLKVRKVVVGYDARATSPMLSNSLIEGISATGADVLSIGLAGTEEMYWAVNHFDADAGIEITASHNPINYNGMKIVKKNSKPLNEKEFYDIKLAVERYIFINSKNSGKVLDQKKEARRAYVEKIMSFVDVRKLKDFRIVINSVNGSAGPVINSIESFLRRKGANTNFLKINHDPDSSFPNGIPNPLLPENRLSTSNAIKVEGADFGVAFDGDFDRCFFFDDKGEFIQSQYIVGLLAKNFLKSRPKENFVCDERVNWNTLDIIGEHGGNIEFSKSGHIFMKRAMRKVDAVYGGEISAHHYFRDFAHCDSGMIPWLILWEFLSQQTLRLSSIIAERRELFPSSEEINFSISQPEACLTKIKKLYESTANSIEYLDGISVSR